jgi:hypothetical protein
MASPRPLSSARSDRLLSGRASASPISVRSALGLSVTLGGIVWILLASSSLSWFGVTPIGVYRSLDQPPILLTLVGLWYTARGLLRREVDEFPDEEDEIR